MDTVETTSLGPGLAAFLIVMALIIVCFLLWYSMIRHLRKVPPTFDQSADDAAATPEESGAPSEQSAEPTDEDQPPAPAG